VKGSALRFAVACVAAWAVTATGFAAPPPAPPPPPVTPGQVKSTLPTQSALPAQGPAPVSNTATNPQGVAPGGEAILVKGFEIDGNAVIPTSELQIQIAGYVGKSLTLSELYDVADVLTRYYRAKGYGLADVTLPAQTLHSGTVRLQVIEGRLGKISVQGNVRTHDAVVQKRIEGLHSGDVYTDSAAERAVLLLNDLPGVGARAVLSPGTEFGTSDLLFNMDETHYTGDASVDDYGRSVIGRWRINADANINSFTGNGDQLGAGITHSDGDRLNFGKLSYALPVGPSGGTFTGSFNRAEYHGLFSSGVSSAAAAELPFSGATENAGLNWQYPEIRSSERSLYWGAGLTYDRSNSEESLPSAPPEKTVTTQIVLLQLSSLYTRVWQDQSNVTISSSLWTNGKHYANLNPPVPGPSQQINQRDERARAEVDSSWLATLADDWSLVNQLNVAYSVNPLTDADKFNLGGPGSVLGYQAAEQRGDSGYFISSELQRSFSWGPYWPMVWGLFLDNGKVWDKQATPSTAALGQTPDTSRGISSAGLDLQLLPSADKLNARLQWAYSIGRKPTDGDGGGHIWLSVGMTF